MSVKSYSLLREALEEYREDGLRLATATLRNGRKGFWPIYPREWDDHDRAVFDRLFVCSAWEVDAWINEGLDAAEKGGLSLSQRLALRAAGRAAP